MLFNILCPSCKSFVEIDDERLKDLPINSREMAAARCSCGALIPQRERMEVIDGDVLTSNNN